ncbi:MAG: ArsR/SmtB family transcription factor [Tissierella sp.]|uniref:ArsR/SmtB family transcription factor n=1 Tax=Tissierella sp. TaxID=41274 RepID=UPI003F9EA0E3
MDNLFKTLGDENRLRIINLLQQGELCVCEMEIILDTTQSNVSRHLTKLRSEKIVIFEKKSQWTYYQINPEFIANNKLLYEYLIDEMDQNDTFILDIKKLSVYTEKGMSCDNIEELNKISFK